jgi:hypothetical protein
MSDIRLEVLYIEPAQLNRPRQVNAILPLNIESGLAPVVAIAGNERSAPIQIQIKGTPTTSR